eukprot:CAMPEP_0174335868 /NCGR_PEP_ID=MMETSP0810-20121108/21135_1 /TAXON_ID=73025 ORGANISM="Eutreptiella gymnastica-like, Strain CCMP1594" /NCGR_SAMPLE_ID=MMETSP0810 /ASSEMBLY_ACC=CAM_ASM_000659 /LENGTH=62 /DNA_ID=CAMNT_0015454521 /DNA_START=33 /DNA_END=221 /DNA_ORIENTATION=+
MPTVMAKAEAAPSSSAALTESGEIEGGNCIGSSALVVAVSSASALVAAASSTLISGIPRGLP